MNLGLVTSYVIAGVLFVSIVVMNLNVSTSGTGLTLTQVNKQHIATVSEMLSYDITKIGFSQNGKVTEFVNPGTGAPYKMISFADSNKIIFNSDVDNDGNIDAVTWEITTNPVSTTENPNDFILIRKQGTEETEITFGITRFSINYYNEYGRGESDKMTTPVTGTDLEDIKQIEIKLVLQSSDKISSRPGSDGNYITTAWEKRFSPVNLK